MNYPVFRRAVHDFRVRSYVLLPRLPVPLRAPRLACLIHTASVHPELGSNSKLKNLNLVQCSCWIGRNKRMYILLFLTFYFCLLVLVCVTYQFCFGFAYNASIQFSKVFRSFPYEDFGAPPLPYSGPESPRTSVLGRSHQERWSEQYTDTAIGVKRDAKKRPPNRRQTTCLCGLGGVVCRRASDPYQGFLESSLSTASTHACVRATSKLGCEACPWRDILPP